uniref:Bifunctional inhibitor/plant lipid transfer protein/seed storage helical domain-containing protein n=1 Tax=Ananas comosus var. bracteatus TaxID=296719 RepID=A0A6V7QT86_ANACO
MRSLYLLALLVIASIIVLVWRVEGARECRKVSADKMAPRLAPCLAVARDLRAPVSPSCCAVVHRLGRSPRCLCAVMLSNTAKSVGIKPQVAMTIPKRCNHADSPVGYKCGGGYFSFHHKRLARQH